MAQARQGLAAHGTAYFALEQTAGRGQRGKQWITEPNQNIMISLVTRPGGAYDTAPFAFSASIALGCYDFFKKYGSPDLTRIKWPNDLYWQDRKAGGVLVESVVSSKLGADSSELGAGNNELLAESLVLPANSSQLHLLRWVIIGVGININQTLFDPSLKNPVSLKQITGKDWDPIVLARELCEAIDLRYKQFLLLTPAEIIADYQSVLYKRGEKVRLKKETAVFETTIKGVKQDGRLVTEDVIEREWVFGDVEWVV